MTAQAIVVYHSGYGHTKAQAEAVFRGLQMVAGLTASIITSDDAVQEQFKKLNEADCIVFGCPTYMGGPSAQFKSFLDATSKIWYQQGWKDKLAAGFTNSGNPSGDKLATLTALMTTAMQHGMIWVGTGLMPGNHGSDTDINRLSSFIGPMAQSPQGSKEPISSDLKTAEHFGKRVGAATTRWVEGKK